MPRWTNIDVWYDGELENASICFPGTDMAICYIERRERETDKRFFAHVDRVADAIDAAIQCDMDNDCDEWLRAR